MGVILCFTSLPPHYTQIVLSNVIHYSPYIQLAPVVSQQECEDKTRPISIFDGLTFPIVMHGVFPRWVEDINSVKRFGKHFQQACLLNTFPLCKAVLGFHLTGLFLSGLFNMNQVVLLKNQNCNFNVFLIHCIKMRNRDSLCGQCVPQKMGEIQKPHTHTHTSNAAGQMLLLFLHRFPIFFFFLILTLTWEEVVGGDENTIIYILLHKKEKSNMLAEKKSARVSPCDPARKWKRNQTIGMKTQGCGCGWSATFERPRPAPITNLFFNVDIKSKPAPLRDGCV